MSAIDVLISLRTEAFTVALIDGDGILVAPAHALTDQHRQSVKAVRAELVELLRSERASELAASLKRRDREGDDRRTCQECGQLSTNGRCKAAARGALGPGVDQRLEPVQAVLMRCQGFTLKEPVPKPFLAASKQAATLQTNGPMPPRTRPSLFVVPVLAAPGFNVPHDGGSHGWSGAEPDFHEAADG